MNSWQYYPKKACVWFYEVDLRSYPNAADYLHSILVSIVPQTYLGILVIIVVHRAKIWVKLLVIPSTLYIISSGTIRDIQQGGSILARTGSIVFWPMCIMSSVIGSYHQALMSSQSIASIYIVLGISGTSKTTQDGYPTPGARLFIWQLFTIWYVHSINHVELNCLLWVDVCGWWTFHNLEYLLPQFLCCHNNP